MIKMEYWHYVLSRGIPKTGQSTVYATGDDGSYQAGWWLGRTLANNMQRWLTFLSGGQNLVLDRATGLIWPRQFLSGGTRSGLEDDWALQLAWAESLNWGGFNDWRMPNINEYLSIMDWSKVSPALPVPPFSDCESEYYWTSTTYSTNTAYAHYISLNSKFVGTASKTNHRGIIVCRSLR